MTKEKVLKKYSIQFKHDIFQPSEMSRKKCAYQRKRLTFRPSSVKACLNTLMIYMQGASRAVLKHSYGDNDDQS